jgi:hypothetical protein
MSLPTPTEGSTGADPALNPNAGTPPVNPAQVSPPAPPSPVPPGYPSSTSTFPPSFSISMNPPVAPPPSTGPTVPADNTDQRIRDLMSQKDRAIREANLHQQKAIELQNTLDQTTQHYSSLVEGATRATDELQRMKAQLEAEKQQLQAEAVKLQVLMAYPEIQPYAKFIPASTDADQVKASVEEFLAARQAEQARAQAAVPPTPSAALRNLYPANNPGLPAIPPAQPSSVAPGDATQKTSDFQARVRALETLPVEQRAAKFNELVKEAEALARQQAGV